MVLVLVPKFCRCKKFTSAKGRLAVWGFVAHIIAPRSDVRKFKTKFAHIRHLNRLTYINGSTVKIRLSTAIRLFIDILYIYVYSYILHTLTHWKNYTRPHTIQRITPKQYKAIYKPVQATQCTAHTPIYKPVARLHIRPIQTIKDHRQGIAHLYNKTALQVNI